MQTTIEIPEGFELKKVSDTEFKVVKKENALPKTWKEFCDTHPLKANESFIMNELPCELAAGRKRDPYGDTGKLPNIRYAEAVIALCQLIQLRDCYNCGWIPNWRDGQVKAVISYVIDICGIYTNSTTQRVLVFKSKELAAEFLHNFRDLIEIAKPLL